MDRPTPPFPTSPASVAPTASPASGLQAEAEAMQALLALLQREQACLADGDADGCAALLEDKAVCVADLAALAIVRHNQLGALGLPASEQGMQQWLALAPTAVGDAWQQLMTVTRDAHELNRVNGLLLGQLAARNRQALGALGLGGDSKGLYGPGGQTDYRPPSTARVVG